MFAKTKKQVLTDLFPHLNPIEFFRVLIESFPLVFVIYNFLKAVFLFDIRIFIMVNFAQKHVHRPAVHSKIPVHCLIYHTFFPRFCISRYAKDSVQVCVFLFSSESFSLLKCCTRSPQSRCSTVPSCLILLILFLLSFPHTAETVQNRSCGHLRIFQKHLHRPYRRIVHPG